MLFLGQFKLQYKIQYLIPQERIILIQVRLGAVRTKMIWRVR